MDSETALKNAEQIITQLSEAAMADTVSNVMQNASSIQHSMQSITNTAVASTCALILAQGGG